MSVWMAFSFVLFKDRGACGAPAPWWERGAVIRYGDLLLIVAATLGFPDLSLTSE